MNWIVVFYDKYENEVGRQNVEAENRAQAVGIGSSICLKMDRANHYGVSELLELPPAPADGDEAMRKEDTLYTYFRLDFKGMPENFDYAICETLEEVHDWLTGIETHLDDPTIQASVIVTGVGMFPKDYREHLRMCEREE